MGPFNNWYICYGPDYHRPWDEAERHGFLSAGGESGQNLDLVQPGDWLWIHVPKKGYVDVGKAISKAHCRDSFAELLPEIRGLTSWVLQPRSKNEITYERFVRVVWGRAGGPSPVPIGRREGKPRFYMNRRCYVVQNPDADSWADTIEWLKGNWVIRF